MLEGLALGLDERGLELGRGGAKRVGRRALGAPELERRERLRGGLRERGAQRLDVAPQRLSRVERAHVLERHGAHVRLQLLERLGALRDPRRVLHVVLLERANLRHRELRLPLRELDGPLVLCPLVELRLESAGLALEHVVEHVHPRQAFRPARVADRWASACRARAGRAGPRAMTQCGGAESTMGRETRGMAARTLL